jgi:uncharacterized membrane protein
VPEPAHRRQAPVQQATSSLKLFRTRALVSRAGRMEYDRILFFTDAVFAIAITLLIVDLPVQINEHGVVNAADQLRKDAPSIAGFALSFAVVALYWMAHHQLFRYVTVIDRNLMRINLLFVGVIAFLPYPTDLLSSVSLGRSPAAVVFYACCAGTAGLLETLAWVYANYAGLTSGVSPQVKWLFFWRAVRIPLIFALSIPIALAGSGHASAATYFWLGIPILGIIINAVYGRHELEEPPDVENPEDPPELAVPEVPEVPKAEEPQPPEPPASPAGPDGGSE